MELLILASRLALNCASRFLALLESIFGRRVFSLLRLLYVFIFIS